MSPIIIVIIMTTFIPIVMLLMLPFQFITCQSSPMELTFKSFCIVKTKQDAESFPVSFTSSNIVLPNGINVSLGHSVRGALELYGITGYTSTSFQPNELHMNISFPVLNTSNGSLMMAATSKFERGIHLKGIIYPNGNEFFGKGYIMVLGVSANGSLKIIDETCKFFVKGKMLHKYEAKLMIFTPRKNLNFSNATYQVQGLYQSDLFQEVYKGVNALLRQAAGKAAGAMAPAQKYFNQKEAVFHQVAVRMKAIQKQASQYTDAYHRDLVRVRSYRRKLKTGCTVRSCGLGELNCSNILVLHTK